MKTILVVDDSPTVVKMISDTLQFRGFKVIEAGNGFEALAKIDENEIDLVIVDLVMPIMNGLELIRSIRGKERHKSTPIILQTAQSQGDIQQEAEVAGATGCIVKPFEPGQLVSSVKKLLAH